MKKSLESLEINPRDQKKLSGAKEESDQKALKMESDEKGNLEKKINREVEILEIFPESLVIFRPLKLNSFYSRHFYVFKYLAKPFLSSACVTVFYNYPSVSLIVLSATYVVDFIFAWR